MGSRSKASRKRRAIAPYLGRIDISWCPECNVPLLKAEACPGCGSPPARPKISPPGDARPAFEHDMKVLVRAIDSTFVDGLGEWLFASGAPVLFNKVGNLDADYQVIANGKNLGNLRFDIFGKEYCFHPTLAGARYIFRYYGEKGLLDGSRPPPKTVEYRVEEEKYIVDGKSVLVPGIRLVDTAVQDGDPCIVYSSNGLLSAGYFIMDGEEIERAMAAGKGHVAKNREHGPPVSWKDVAPPDTFPRSTWDDVVRVNESFIKEKVAAAISFINKVRAKHTLPVAVAYSGGKDSLVTLLLVKKAMEASRALVDGEATGDKPLFSLIFADTGLELPEVLRNVDDVIEWLGPSARACTSSIGDKFWELAGNFGPPARDFRFCCHTLKARQVNQLVEEIAVRETGDPGSRVLVFLGQRRYESFSRAGEKRVYTNSYIPLQVAATPIKDWTALDEWVFLFGERARDPSIPVNSLYFEGHDRLGCYLCPAQSLSSFAALKRTHPDLYARWMEFLAAHARERGLPREWIDWGLWRFKRPKGQWKALQSRLPHPVRASSDNGGAVVGSDGDRGPGGMQGGNFSSRTPIGDDGAGKPGNFQPADFFLYITKGVSPCVHGGFSVKARIAVPFLLEDALPWARLVDKRVTLDEDSGLLYIDAADLKFMLYADGSVFLQSTKNGFDLDGFLRYIFGAVARSVACQRCGVCARICPVKAIRVDDDGDGDGLKLQPGKCIGFTCQECMKHCPVYQIVNENVKVVGE